MNKIHYYLSNNLWEVVKSYFNENSGNGAETKDYSHGDFIWGMIVCPNQYCFSSHISVTPWQQSWTALKLLETSEFRNSDSATVKKEIDFQFTLRDFIGDGSLELIFKKYGDLLSNNGEWDTESLSLTTELLIHLLEVSPSTAHCFAQQLSSVISLSSDSQNPEYALLLVRVLDYASAVEQAIGVIDGSFYSELLPLLLCKHNTTHVAEIEEKEKHEVVESSLVQLEKFLHSGIDPKSIIPCLVLTGRHIVPYLLDLLQLSLPVTMPENVPNFLWPLLLLQVWGKPGYSESQVHSLIDLTKSLMTDQMLLRVSFMLEWYENFSRWSANRGNEKQLGLEAARDHSVLRLLHSSTDLSHTEWAQVRALLHEQWETTLLDAFYAHVLLLRALVAYSALRRDRVRLQDAGEFEQRFASDYETKVTCHLEQIKKLVRDLKPLKFRLEVMENLFALLFSNHEDIENVSLTEKTSREGSSTGSGRRGFICGPHLLRDVVSIIKDCTAELEREPKTEVDQSGVVCSISPTQMENRLDRLSESLSEATWRLQLVTSPELAADVGGVSSTHERHNLEPEWLVDSWNEQGRLKIRRSVQERREESGSQSPSSGLVEADRGHERLALPNFMNQMLGSDGSLVVRCLAQGDLLNAEHIIAMMSTEESRQVLEGELNFTRALNELRRRIQSVRENKSEESLPQKTGTRKKPGGFQAVQLLAAQAVTATALSGHVERFLSTVTLPVIQGSAYASLGTMLQGLENPSAIVTLDLALTAANSYQDFQDLLTVACKHCPELVTRIQAPLPTTSLSKPLGFIGFTHTLMSLLHECNKELAISPIAFLRTRHTSFSLKILKDQQNLWKQLKVLEEEIMKNRSDESSSKEIGRSQKKVKVMQKLLESVTKLTDSSQEVVDVGRNDGTTSEMTKNLNFNYFELFNRYLSDLASLSVDFLPSKSDVEECEVSVQKLLEQSAVEVLDRLVFQYHVEPALLEKKAQQLGFNLCASLVWGCCPPIPEGGHFSQFPLPNFELGSTYVILNASMPSSNCDKIEDPVNAVITILTALLDALRAVAAASENEDGGNCSHFLTLSLFQCAASDPSVTAILESTGGFKTINTSHLNPEGLFFFYANLCNLMTLHALLNDQACEDFWNEESLARDGSIWFMGYEIGCVKDESSRFLSIGDCRALLCGQQSTQVFTSLPHTSMDSISTDPRAVFMVPTSQCCYSKLKLPVVPNEPIEIQLVLAIESYGKHNITRQEGKLRVPPLLFWYLHAVLLPERPADLSDFDHANILLKFLLNNSQDSSWQATLKSYLALDLILEVTSVPKSKSCVVTDYCDDDVAKIGNNDLPVAESMPRWKTRVVTDGIMRQFSQGSRVLGEVVGRIHEGRAAIDVGRVAHQDGRSEGQGRVFEVARDVLLHEKFKCMEALFSAPWLAPQVPVFDNNYALAALHKGPPSHWLWRFLRECTNEKRWLECWGVIKAVPDFVLHCDVNLRRFRDLVLFELATQSSLDGSDSPWLFTQQISNIHLRIQSAKLNHLRWPGAEAVRIILQILRDGVEEGLAAELEVHCRTIKILTAIKENCFYDQSLLEISTLASTNPGLVLQSLMQHNQIQLCKEWLNQPGVMESLVEKLDGPLVVQLAAILPGRFTSLFSKLAPDRALALCHQIIPKLTTLSSIRGLTQLCCELNKEKETMYMGVLLGLEAVSCVTEEEGKQLIHLIWGPWPSSKSTQIENPVLLIIEQLTINTRLDSLAKVLSRLREIPETYSVPWDEINNIITQYASRALELKVIRVEGWQSGKPGFQVPLLPTTDFEVPANVPAKSQWVADNQVSVCMCCRLVSFSMFNRRHHCRRCGRVVCATCSPQRMQVEGYEGVAVRVCTACYSHHMKSEVTSTEKEDVSRDGSTREECFEWTWSLTTDPACNARIREEFNYEHSPNPSLCLALFSLLPTESPLTSLLLDESEKLLEMLQGSDAANNPELDSTVVIKIIRTLIIGAKVRYGQAGFSMGVVACDRLLSQVDVITLLIRNHCTRLIPQEPLKPNTVRALRDRLVQEELWDLAIEMSRKAGLSDAGVWASWGKIALAAGCWSDARLKFSQCLEPAHYSARNSPLLDEICQIIESTTFSINQDGSGINTAFEVLESLGNLKQVASSGWKTPVTFGPGNVQYSEQEWYLTRYGSSAALIKFYMKHSQWNSVLDLLLQRQMDSDMFLQNILLPAFRNNEQNLLFNAMTALDPTLEMFKKFLGSACVKLQKSQSLHILYQVQLLMKDNVRAAMTCIQLYRNKSENFKTQVDMANLLHTAIRHLEEEILFDEGKVTRVGNVMHLSCNEINRHINTALRQLEVAKFLAAYEAAGRPMSALLRNLSWEPSVMPTIFDGQNGRNIVAALCVMAGKNVEEGFGVSFRIIQDYNGSYEEAYTKVAEYLGSQGHVTEIMQLAESIKTSVPGNGQWICDRVLVAAAQGLASGKHLSSIENIISSIITIDNKIMAYIKTHQLKAAYLRAVQYGKLEAVQLIMEEAQRCGMSSIREICMKKLGLSTETSSVSSVYSGE